MLNVVNGLLRSCKPVVVATALVAVLGVTGTAYSAKLITGLDVKDGSLTSADFSKSAANALRGTKGARGVSGQRGAVGAVGATGATGATGLSALGAQGAQGNQGVQGNTGSTGSTGSAGATGPQGISGTAEGAVCTVPGPLHGTIHWSNVGGTTWTMGCNNAA